MTDHEHYNPWGFWYPKCLRTPAKPKAKMSHLDRVERNLKIIAALLVFEFIMLALLVVHNVVLKYFGND